MTYVLFYKHLVAVGGAENLLLKHYDFLKRNSVEVKIVCFSVNRDLFKNIDILNDIIVLQNNRVIVKILKLQKFLRKIKNPVCICHSGYIEFGLACLMGGKRYSVFIHQPSSMSFNETDKFTIFFWKRFLAFSKDQNMVKKLAELRKRRSLLSKIFIHSRCIISQLILRRASNIFVLSKYAEKEKKSVFGLKAKKHAGAISNKSIELLKHKSEPRPTPDTPVLVSLSRLDENKRIDLILAALSELKKSNVDFIFYICGTGPARLDLEKQVQRLKLEKNVYFLGFLPQSEVEILYQKMDLFITIDWAEFKLTLFEVLSHKRKIIVSTDTELDGRITKSGYVFTSNPNSDDLKKNILKALDERSFWSEKMLSSYLLEFSWDNYFTGINHKASNVQ